eukprot:COSAG03_NODE_3924_length_1758_cov_5.943339_1_plen_167_part_00
MQHIWASKATWAKEGLASLSVPQAVSLPLSLSLSLCFSASLTPLLSLCRSYSKGRLVRLSPTALDAARLSLFIAPRNHYRYSSPPPPQSAPHCDLRGRDRRARVVGSLATGPHQLSRSTRRCSSRAGGETARQRGGEGEGGGGSRLLATETEVGQRAGGAGSGRGR